MEIFVNDITYVIMSDKTYFFIYNHEYFVFENNRLCKKLGINETEFYMPIHVKDNVVIIFFFDGSYRKSVWKSPVPLSPYIPVKTDSEYFDFLKTLWENLNNDDTLYSDVLYIPYSADQNIFTYFTIRSACIKSNTEPIKLDFHNYSVLINMKDDSYVIEILDQKIEISLLVNAIDISNVKLNIFDIVPMPHIPGSLINCINKCWYYDIYHDTVREIFHVYAYTDKTLIRIGSTYFYFDKNMFGKYDISTQNIYDNSLYHSKYFVLPDGSLCMTQFRSLNSYYELKSFLLDTSVPKLFSYWFNTISESVASFPDTPYNLLESTGMRNLATVNITEYEIRQYDNREFYDHAYKSVDKDWLLSLPALYSKSKFYTEVLDFSNHDFGIQKTYAMKNSSNAYSDITLEREQYIYITCDGNPLSKDSINPYLTITQSLNLYTRTAEVSSTLIFDNEVTIYRFHRGRSAQNMSVAMFIYDANLVTPDNLQREYFIKKIPIPHTSGETRLFVRVCRYATFEDPLTLTTFGPVLNSSEMYTFRDSAYNRCNRDDLDYIASVRGDVSKFANVNLLYLFRQVVSVVSNDESVVVYSQDPAQSRDIVPCSRYAAHVTCVTPNGTYIKIDEDVSLHVRQITRALSYIGQGKRSGQLELISLSKYPNKDHQVCDVIKLVPTKTTTRRKLGYSTSVLHWFKDKTQSRMMEDDVRVLFEESYFTRDDNMRVTLECISDGSAVIKTPRGRFSVTSKLEEVALSANNPAANIAYTVDKVQLHRLNETTTIAINYEELILYLISSFDNRVYPVSLHIPIVKNGAVLKLGLKKNMVPVIPKIVFEDSKTCETQPDARDPSFVQPQIMLARILFRLNYDHKII